MPSFFRPVVVVASLSLFVAAFTAPRTSAALTVVAPRCENLVDPLGVDVARPRLGWKLAASDGARGERQTAYRVLVASTAEKLARDDGDLWDSGRVASDESLFVPYTGHALVSAQRVFWKVRAYDAAGQPAPWSAPATWTMGVLPALTSSSSSATGSDSASGWSPDARWITDADLLTRARKALGFSSEETTDENAVKWVQLDLGAAHTIDLVRLHALRHTVNERLGYPRRFKLEAADNPAMRDAALIADLTATDYNAWLTKTDLPAPAGGVTARYLRLTATKLRRFQGDYSLALSQIEVLSAGKNVAVGAAVAASDSRETGLWSSAAVVDGLGLSGANPRANDAIRLRREFTVRPGLRRALFHVSGLGHYELSVNGARASERLLTPGWTEPAKTILYDTHDLTARLRPGANALGLTLAGGMYNVQESKGRYVKFASAFRPLLAWGELRLEYADGSVERVVTDTTWRAGPGPITFSNVFSGEDYDARREAAGWDRAGFDDAAWTPAAEAKPPGGQLLGATHASPAFATFETFKPAAAPRELKPGMFIYDFGQNVSMMPRLRVRGPAGAIVRLTPAELLKADGALDRGSSAHGGTPAYWQYTLRGDAAGGAAEAETYFPKFFYHGARYLQAELIAPDASPASAPVVAGNTAAATPPVVGAAAPSAARPEIVSLESVVTHSDSAPAGDFSSSSELFNRIRTLVRWAQRSNLAHVITDCPHRERLGWLEQYHLNGPALRYEWDLTQLFRKAFRDLADSQTERGLIPSIAPEFIKFEGGFRDSPEWGGTVVLAAWQHYVFTGDDAPLRENFPTMQRYVAYLDGLAKDGILSHGLGDWYDVGPKRPGNAQLTPVPLTATAIYFEITRTLGRIAAHLGKTDDAQRHAASAAAIGAAFNAKFFDRERLTYATGSQTSLAMPLVLDLVPAADRAAVFSALVSEIQGRGHAVTAGDVGYRYLLRALSDGGRSDVIFAMNNQSEKPGYGFQLAKGATSLTEAWDANPHSSQNHFMLGQIVEWFYHDLAGLRPDPASPGFKHIVVKPAIVDGLDWVQASHETPYGRATSGWKREGNRLTLVITIPVGATATVHVPALPRSIAGSAAISSAPVERMTVLEGLVRGHRIDDGRKGVTFLRSEGGAKLYAIGAGTYRFVALGGEEPQKSP